MKNLFKYALIGTGVYLTIRALKNGSLGYEDSEAEVYPPVVDPVGATPQVVVIKPVGIPPVVIPKPTPKPIPKRRTPVIAKPGPILPGLTLTKRVPRVPRTPVIPYKDFGLKPPPLPAYPKTPESGKAIRPKTVNELYGGRLRRPAYSIAPEFVARRVVVDALTKSKRELDSTMRRAQNSLATHKKTAEEILQKRKDSVARIQKLQAKGGDASLAEEHKLHQEIADSRWGLGYNVSHANKAVDSTQKAIERRLDWDRKKIGQNFGSRGVLFYDKLMAPVKSAYEGKLRKMAASVSHLPILASY